jgi:hypothetical protein
MKIHASEIERQTDQDYMSRKLVHYNTWLFAKQDPAEKYPGFPDDVERDRAVANLKAATVKQAEKKERPVHKPAVKAKRKSSAEGPTKQDKATDIYRELNGVKEDVIAAIQSELGMSLAGATTYYYNARKLA